MAAGLLRRLYLITLPAIGTEIAADQRAQEVAARKGCVSVMVPIYNEIDHIDELVRQIQASPVQKEINIIDDGATDGTCEKLINLRPSPDITLIFHDYNCGKGAAIRAGLGPARGEYILIQDTDLERDPRDYRAQLGPLRAGKAKMVQGVRPDRPERGVDFFLGAKLTGIAN
jgi:glycosyltransferase involved in cell wall biosynthesis